MMMRDAQTRLRPREPLLRDINKTVHSLSVLNVFSTCARAGNDNEPSYRA